MWVNHAHESKNTFVFVAASAVIFNLPRIIAATASVVNVDCSLQYITCTNVTNKILYLPFLVLIPSSCLTFSLLVSVVEKRKRGGNAAKV